MPRTATGKLARVALLNLDLWDPQRSSGDRPSAKMSLSGFGNAGSKVTVHHLNADNGALAQQGMTYTVLKWTLGSKGKQKKVKDDSNVLDITNSKVDVVVKSNPGCVIGDSVIRWKKLGGIAIHYSINQ
jgi:hypothetical protein